MDGIHDLGGKSGFGKVDVESGLQVFDERWEASVFAMTNAIARAGAFQNTDRFRHAIERINSEAYLQHGYYGRWLGAIENLLVEAGIIEQSELDQRAFSKGATATDLIAALPLKSPDLMGPAPKQIGSQREVVEAPQFVVGDRVRSIDLPVKGHTRLPAYVRGKVGEIVAWHSGWIFPDTNAHGLGEHPKHLYTVNFLGEELWGKGGFSVNLDLFEPYLEIVDDE